MQWYYCVVNIWNTCSVTNSEKKSKGDEEKCLLWKRWGFHCIFNRYGDWWFVKTSLYLFSNFCFRYVCISPAEFLFSYRADVCFNVCFLKIFCFFLCLLGVLGLFKLKLLRMISIWTLLLPGYYFVRWFTKRSKTYRRS